MLAPNRKFMPQTTVHALNPQRQAGWGCAARGPGQSRSIPVNPGQRTVPTGLSLVSGGISVAATTAILGTQGSIQRLTW